MADKRAYFKLDVGYLTNPKVAIIAATNPRAILLHVASIGYAAQHLTNGVVPVALLLRLTGASKRDAGRLFDSGLWVDLSDGSAEVHDYLEHQRSADEARGATEKAKRAAGARWHPPSNASSNTHRNAEPMPIEREKRETTSGGADKPPADLVANSAQPLVAEWIEHCAERPPSRVVGQVAKEVRQLLDDKIQPDAIRRGLAEWSRKGLHPSTLASVVHEVQTSRAPLAVVTDPSQLPPVEESWMRRPLK